MQIVTKKCPTGHFFMYDNKGGGGKAAIFPSIGGVVRSDGEVALGYSPSL